MTFNGKDVKIPTGGQKEVKKATETRITKSKLKSGAQRGPRDTKISVLIPRSLYEEIRLMSRALDRSVGDMVNEYLEGQVKAHKKEIEALRQISPKSEE